MSAGSKSCDCQLAQLLSRDPSFLNSKIQSNPLGASKHVASPDLGIAWALGQLCVSLSTMDALI